MKPKASCVRVDEAPDRSDISIMASDPGGSYSTSESSATTYSGSDSTYSEKRQNDSSEVGSGALKGAGTGAALGGIAGLVVGMAGLAIPGIGAVIAAGPLAAALAGAGAGAIAGGLIGALVNIGVPEDEANYYAEGMRRGGVLVTVNARDEDMADQAADIMRDHGAVDIEERAASGSRQAGVALTTAAPYAGDTSTSGRDSVYADDDIGSGRRSGTGGTSAYGSAYTGMERRRNNSTTYQGVERRAA
jgi:hypothetical protein